MTGEIMLKFNTANKLGKVILRIIAEKGIRKMSELAELTQISESTLYRKITKNKSTELTITQLQKIMLALNVTREEKEEILNIVFPFDS